MINPIVLQLKFARSEFVRGLEGVAEEEGILRFESINALSWIVGHIANQENFYWNHLAQGIRIAPELRKLVGTGQPASTPPLHEMWALWKEITTAADSFLDQVRPERLIDHFTFGREPWRENIGALLQRNIYHYWFHLGEGMAIRQLLGHTDLPQFVGNMSALNPDAE